MQKIIFDIQHAMMWYLLPNGCGLRLTHNSSKQDSHEGLKTVFMWSLKAWIRSRIIQALLAWRSKN